MATDEQNPDIPEIMTAPHLPTSPDNTTRKINLNVIQITAAALAAVTTAVLVSRLGAAGTIIGAAGASVITTVGSALYQASLERSRERVRSLAQRTRPSPTSREESRTERAHPAATDVQLGYEHSQRFLMLRWGAVTVGALGAFVLAMMVITGFEWASGATVGGNGEGTTIGRVVTDQPGPRDPATPPAPSPAGPASETPTPTETTDAPSTSTTPDDDDADVEQSPTTTSDRPAPSEVTPTPPLIPPGVPGIGG